LRLLAELVERLHRAESRQEVLDAALDGMAALLVADRASILLFGEDDRVHFVAWRGLSDDYRAAVDGHSPWRREDADAQPITVADVAASDLGEALKRRILAEGVRSLAFFPLARREALLGKFMLYCDRVRVATREEIDLGKVVAMHLAAALGRILDREELERR
jgi:GAF domain-containing protein